MYALEHNRTDLSSEIIGSIGTSIELYGKSANNYIYSILPIIICAIGLVILLGHNYIWSDRPFNKQMDKILEEYLYFQNILEKLHFLKVNYSLEILEKENRKIIENFAIAPKSYFLNINRISSNLEKKK